MQQRGRKSPASLSVVVGTIDGRPKAPDDLTQDQAEVWERTVSNEPKEFFRTAATQELLKQYCRHVVSASRLGGLVEEAEQSELSTAADLGDYDRLLRMRERETKAVLSVATKLRITNQSRYTDKAAGTAARNAPDRKLWERRA